MSDATAKADSPDFPGGTLAYAMAFLVALGDLLIVSQWISGALPTLNALGLHLAIAAVYGVAAYVLLDRRRPSILLFALLLLLLGPLGGFLLFLFELNDGPPTGDLSRLRDEVRQGPAATRSQMIYRDIRQNRRPLLDGTLPASFIQVLDEGTITRQYRVIAAISRHYTPQMLPSLRHALASPIPVLRVQAAAVFAKLRGDFGERADLLLKSPDIAPDQAAARQRVHDMLDVAESGFVDAETQALLVTRALAFADKIPDLPDGSTAGAGVLPAGGASDRAGGTARQSAMKGVG